jgi:hypothetical protein
LAAFAHETTGFRDRFRVLLADEAKISPTPAGSTVFDPAPV